MTDIIYRTEQIWVIIWFKMRLEEFMPIHGHLIFIRIQNTDLSVFVQSLDTLKQCVRCKLIIMIRKSNIITCGDLDSRICIL